MVGGRQPILGLQCSWNLKQEEDARFEIIQINLLSVQERTLRKKRSLSRILQKGKPQHAQRIYKYLTEAHKPHHGYRLIKLSPQG